MPILRIPTPLRSYTGGITEIPVAGDTVGQALQDLVVHYPALETHLFTTNHTLRPFINLFLGEENIRTLQGLDTPVQTEDRLLLVPGIAGGSYLC